MSKHLEGGYELLLTQQELSGSGEDYRTLRRMESILSQRKGQKDKEFVEEQKSFIHRPEERAVNDCSFCERRPSGVKHLQKCPRPRPKDLRRSGGVPRTIKEREKAKPIGTELTHKGTGYPNCSLCCGQCIKYEKNSYGIHSQGAVKDNEEIPMQIIDEIRLIKSSIDVQVGKFDAKLNRLTSDINDLKNNDRNFSECHKVTYAKLESIPNTCYRFERKFQVDELEDLPINKINDQLAILKTHVEQIVNNTNLVEKHFCKK
ncbi:hypothetical protein O181_044851 [Austropuccinia psidii MF-1]|uniref:Uncharacterized protein n=1 Tax=Austropuccinia psidii MF-1 TaxID=1389203 RepID=A0A9Q3HH81_9BASI|nr:hypothetical protein [Austropuccinia psidii MF-1]